MSLTITVPASVPSLFHSSAPLAVSSATKKSCEPTAVRDVGAESAFPGAMSLTSRVPAAVPSLTHSSSPSATVLLTK